MRRAGFVSFALLFLSRTVSGQFQVEEFSIPSGAKAYQITSGPDQALWFTEPIGGRIGRVSLFGEVTEFSLPIGSAPVSITLGPDGALWFTDSGKIGDLGKIGRITTNGHVTEFPLPWAAPLSIVAGPDGALWFTVFFLFAVGRITTTGAVSSYPTPGTPITMDQIVAGSDGALWFTEAVEPRINRMTTSGQITTFPLPVSATTFGLTPGPDGALWLSVPGRGIGRVTTSGIYTEFGVSGVSGGSGVITTSRDGYIWFVEEPAGRIGRMTTSGVVTEFPVPMSSQPQAIASGPDGSIWFTETDRARIGRLFVGTALPAIPALSLWALGLLGTSLAMTGIILLRRSP